MSEESVYRGADGRWCAKYKDARGTWKYIYRSTKSEAKKALRQALKDRDDGIIPPAKLSAGNLLDEWLEDLRDDVSRRTWLTREGIVRLHIKPSIGTKRLGALTAEDARKLNRKKSGQGLASSSVRRVHELLCQAIRYAVRRRYVSRNPLEDAILPKASYREINVFTPQQIERLLDSVRGHRWESVIVLGAMVGLTDPFKTRIGR